MSDMPSPEQVRHNQSLWKWFPLGQIDAAWNIVEHISSAIGYQDYKSEVDAVLDALQKLDDRIRADRYPLPTKKVKQNHEATTRRKKVSGRRVR